MQKIKWGLIGCGDIARKRVIPALLELENCELISISRENYLLTESFAKEYGIKKWFRY
jgi:predicted dehydrogenase